MDFDTLNDMLKEYGVGVAERGRIARVLPFETIEPQQLDGFLAEYGVEALLKGLFAIVDERGLVIDRMGGNPHH